MKRTHLTLPGLALVLLCCGRHPDAGAPPPPLVEVVALAASTDQPVELRGSAAARSRIRLGFKQPGVVAEVRAQEGDAVRQGQLLATLDEVDARAQLRVAAAHREKARRDAERAARLVAEGALASSVRDDAQSQLEAAEAQVAQAEDALARTRLLAPSAGTVFARLAEPGETVGAGTPILVLDTTGLLVVKAPATERERQALRVGQAARLTGDAGEAFPGRVTSIATTPNAADGLYTVEVTPEAGRRLLPGTLLRVRFEPGRKAAELRIPLEAVVHRQDRDFVFVLQAGGTVRQVAVEVDEAEGREIVVRSGLEGGERVVAEGAYFLQDGQRVRTIERSR